MSRRPAWWLTFLAWVWPVTRWSAMATRVPLIGPLVALLTRPVFTGRNFNVTYIPVNRNIAGAGSTFLPKRVIEALIQRSAHRVIIRRCTCRDCETCGHYPIEDACLLLGEDTKVIDPRIAKHIGVDEALAHTEKMLNLGLTPLTGRVRMDNYFYGVPNKGRMLTICFCCPCCCTIMKSARYFPDNVSQSLVRVKGLRIEVDESKCVKCGTCAGECFVQAITIGEKAALHDDARCKGCGRCVSVCLQGAVSASVDNVDAAVDEMLGRIREYVNYE